MAKLQSLRGKFVKTLLLVTGVLGLATLAIVVVTSAQASTEHLAAVQTYIEEGISSKGRVLTENHARALRGLTLDNAFLDMQRLVERAVAEDADLVYGVYVNNERETLGFSRRGAAAAEKLPVKDAWRTLQIPAGELLVKAEAITRTTRLGEEVLEVAAPVSGEDGELVGTVRYGLSTRRMHDAIARAKAEARARLFRSVFLVGSLVTVATLLGLLLSRAQAVRITRPVAELTVAAETLASGDRAVRVKIDSGDELELLGASFNRMVEDLDASYRQLETMNRTLEHKVEERTVELGRKNRDMRLVLDNVDQGFITLDMDGVMALERSRVVDQWFGGYDRRMPFADYIGRISRVFAIEFQLAWEQLLEDVLPVEAALTVMPQRLTSGGRTWSLRYLTFHREGQLEGLLVVIAEITERLAKEREEAEQSELMQGFKKLMLDRSEFNSFLREGTQMVEAICTRSLDADKVSRQRALHTLKGNAAAMGLTVVARICHGLEEQLAESDDLSDEGLAELNARWTSIIDHVASFTGRSSQRVIEVPEAEYAAVISRLSQAAAPGDVLRQVLAWQLEPVTIPLRRLGDQAKALARRLKRGEIQVEIQGNGVRVDPKVMSPLFAELVHVVRNAVDHGLETPEERDAKKKPRHGTLAMRAQAAGGNLTLEIIDDGRGIDWEVIARKAQQRGLPHSTPAHLVQALCADGLSTRDEVTDTSGRGVGMAALKQRVEAMNGRLEVRSAPGVGTSVVIRVPWSGPVSRSELSQASG